MLWTRHTTMLFADKSQAGAWSDMHTGGLAVGTGRVGHFLGRQAAQSGGTAGSASARGDWYQPLEQ